MLSVFTGEVFEANVAIVDGRVVGVGDYSDGPHYDVSGRYLVPGFIDGHCHIESSKLDVDQFARAVLRSGTTGVVVDPHELANVLGVAGINYVLEASEGIPLDVYVMVPSCVPASPFESPWQPLEASDYVDVLRHERVTGIAEMMNYPAAIGADPDVMSKMELAGFQHVDGHAPGISGRELNAYLVSGPATDHECTTLEEAREKKRLGMWVMLREASMIRNLVDLLPLVKETGTDNCLFVTDDREAGTLLAEGHINSMVATAVRHGVPVGDAVKLGSLNVARCHDLPGRGAIAPGYMADIAVLSDLESFVPDAVFKNGRLVVEAGTVLPFERPAVTEKVTSTVRIAPVSAETFRVADNGEQEIRVIELIPDQVVTRASAGRAARRDGELVADPDSGLAKLAVVERHHASGRVGTGFVRGFGLRAGAFASTIAHDAHNITVVGVNDADMAVAVQRLADIDGGLVVVRDGEVLDELPLPIAGLMSREPAEVVAASLERLEGVLARLGVHLGTPFMYLGFLALSVIPEMRLTDQGIVDVRTFELVPLGAS